METCDVCGKVISGDGEYFSLYKSYLLKRVKIKGALTSSVASQYAEFRPVKVHICSRHKKNLLSQRLMSGLIVFVVAYIPIMLLLSLLINWTGNEGSRYLITGAISLILAVLMVRRITYDGFIASLMTMQSRSREGRDEYFADAKYQRIMRGLARGDAELEKTEAAEKRKK